MGFSSTYVTRFMMDSVRSPRLPDLPQNIHLDLSRSPTQIGKCVIDTSKDEELKKRERVWEFHQKNRGVMAKSRVHRASKVERERRHENEEGDISRGGGGIFDSDVEKMMSRSPRRHLPKIRYTRTKSETRNSSNMSSVESIPSKKDLKDMATSYTYSSALTIGNSIYTKLKGQQRDHQKVDNAAVPLVIDRNKKPSNVSSIERLPDLSAALTKLGYLKLARNVVHYGGGFFGRPTDRRYADIRRSFSMLESEKRHREVNNHYAPELVDHFGSLQHLKRSHETPSPLKLLPQSTKPSSEKRENGQTEIDKREKYKPDPLPEVPLKRHEEVKPPRPKPVVSEAVRKYEEKRKRIESTEEFEIEHRQLILQHERRSNTTMLPSKKETVEKKEPNSNRESKRNTDTDKREKTCPEMKPEAPERVDSNTSLDIPDENFGSSSQQKEAKTSKSPWMYGINPYRWTSKSSLTDDDKPWVERAMQKTEIVDQTTYDGFARTKPVKNQSSD